MKMTYGNEWCGFQRVSLKYLFVEKKSQKRLTKFWNECLIMQIPEKNIQISILDVHPVCMRNGDGKSMLKICTKKPSILNSF